MTSPRPSPKNLREAHAHLAQAGRAMSMVDLAGCADRGEMLDRLGSAKPNASGWVLAHGARPDAWPDPSWPTRLELDATVGSSTPCVAWCFDYHALIASSTAMEQKGFNPKKSRPYEPRVVASGLRTTQDRSLPRAARTDPAPSALLLELDALAMWNAVPEPSKAERRAHVRAACAHLASLGYREAHDLKAQPWLGPVLCDLESAGELALARVVLYPLLPDLDQTCASRDQWQSIRLTLGGTKIFTDGTLNSRTAWMLEDFADAPADHPCGMPMMTHAQIDDAISHAASHRLPIAAHAIGDGAVRAVLDAIERDKKTGRGCPGSPGVGSESRPTQEPPAHRIEHAELTHPDDIGRFARLGVVCSVQPCHLLADIEALRRAVPDRLDRVLPLRSLIDAGCAPGTGLIFGSDIPIVHANPQDSIQAAVQRRRLHQPEFEAIGLVQAISENEAWACFAR